MITFTRAKTYFRCEDETHKGDEKHIKSQMTEISFTVEWEMYEYSLIALEDSRASDHMNARKIAYRGEK